jgi:uncharacterized repeat protein (TIGR01451 family)
MLDTFTRRTERRKQRRSRHFFQPQLTVLEDRVSPAAFTVNTIFDTHARNLITGTDITGRVSLRSAIEAANHLGGSNTISLAAETYDLSLGQLDISNNLTLTGVGASKTTINAQFNSRIFQVFSGFTVVISKVTMEEGGVGGAPGNPAQGGAIFDSGALTLTNDTLFQNLAIGGDGADGAPGANGANGTSTSSPTNGVAGGDGQRGGDAKGGAIYLDSSAGAALIVANCSITDNEAFQGQGGSGGQGGKGGGAGLSTQQGAIGGVGGNGGQGGNALGGGIYNAGGSLVIQGSLFSGNLAGVADFLFGPIAGGGSGGAGASGGDAIPVGKGGGTGGNGGMGGFGGEDSGGAIYNSSSGFAAIAASSFSQNSAIGMSGGPAGDGGSGGSTTGGASSTPAVGGTGGTGGPAGDASGGAIDNQGAMTIDNTTFFQNQATGTNGGAGGAGGIGGQIIASPNGFNGGNGGNGGFGGTDFAGAIESSMGSLTLTHSTVSLNSAGPGAGGMFGAPGAASGNGGSDGSPGSPGGPGNSWDGGIQSVSAKTQLLDTIVAGDTAPKNPDVNGHFSSLGHNLIGNATGSSGFTASGDQVGTATHPINPMLSAPGNHGGPTPTMVPLVGSPVIDAGDNTNAPPTDQRGLPRIVDGDSNVDNDGPVIDIGAVEFQPTNVSITAKGSPSSVSPGGTLTYTLTISTGKGDNAVVTSLTLTDPMPAQTTFESFTAPVGWIVTEPAVGHTGTVTASFALGQKATASFTLVVKVSQTAAGSTLSNTSTIATTSPQPTSAGKSATVKTTVTHGGSTALLVGPLSLALPAASSSTDLASDKVVVDGAFAANDGVHGSEPLIFGPAPDSAPVDSALVIPPFAVRRGVHGPKSRPELPGDPWSEDLSSDRLDW